ncbi:hypothetical protein FRB90_010398 [Tulasnella sp. 427]|nr:hypothetical protein FRB90_010398 [Tulasnella sp. 427]
MGTGHRRISSLSDPGPNVVPPTPSRSNTLSDAVNLVDGLPPSPVTHSFEDLKNGDGNTIKTKRLSLLAKRDHSPPGLAPASVLTAELESVRGELASTKKELDAAKHDLAEAIDKREASDACIKALREFIAEQAIGESTAVAPSSSSIKDDASSFDGVRSPSTSLKGLRLPPLPTEDNIPEDAASSTGPKKSGWGLRLWNSAATKEGATPASEASSVPAANPQLPASSSSSTAATPASTPLTSFVSSWTRSVSGGSQPTPATPSSQPPTPAEPTTAGPTTGLRKFSFFGKAPTPAAAAKDPQTTSMHSTAASISSTRTPDLVHSVSTSPQTDTTSLRSGVLSEEDELQGATVLFLDPSSSDKSLGDATPTLSSSAVSVNEDNADRERMESVAL